MKQWTRIADWTTAVSRAETIFSRWLEAGQLAVDDIERVFNAEYNYIATFKHNKDVYGVISGASTMDEAYAAAQKIYGNDLDAVEVEWVFDPRKYKGAISRYNVTDDGGEEVVVDERT